MTLNDYVNLNFLHHFFFILFSADRATLKELALNGSGSAEHEKCVLSMHRLTVHNL